MNNELTDYKLSSRQVAEALSLSQKYIQNSWRKMKDFPKPRKQNRRSLVWSISEVEDYKQKLQTL